MRRTLSVSASILALVCCSDVHAQTAPPADGASNGGIETVVVTAERRSENLMTAPVTASVLSGADLQSRDVFSVNSLQFVVPNLTVNSLGQGVDSTSAASARASTTHRRRRAWSPTATAYRLSRAT